MDFELNEQQEMLQKSAREFLKDVYTEKVLKEMAKSPQGYTPELWNKMAELGWMALSIPEAYGGIGDFIDLTVVLQEMGRVGLISPFFSSLVLGASSIMIAGNEAQKKKYLPEIAEGKKIITLAVLEKTVHYSPENILMRAIPQGEEYLLKGTKLFVPDANVANYIICAAKTQEAAGPDSNISLFLVDAQAAGITCNLLDTIAPDNQCEVIFNNVRVTKDAVLGQINHGWIYLEKVLEKAAVATCALMVGGAEKVLDLTLSYAKDRSAFGHPIGAYQSVQHRCADMLMDVETSRFATYRAAWKINERLPATLEASIAKAWVSQAFRRVVTSSHQIHGAIGFTQDHILHWYTKRARTQEMSFGDINFHLQRLLAESK